MFPRGFGQQVFLKHIQILQCNTVLEITLIAINSFVRSRIDTKPVFLKARDGERKKIQCFHFLQHEGSSVRGAISQVD